MRSVKITRLRSKVVEIEAVRYEGLDDFGNILEFVPPDQLKTETVQHGDETASLEVKVWNTEEDAWITVPLGHWIFKGVRGEFYPCSDEVMKLKYDVLEVAVYSRGPYGGSYGG